MPSLCSLLLVVQTAALVALTGLVPHILVDGSPLPGPFPVYRLADYSLQHANETLISGTRRDYEPSVPAPSPAASMRIKHTQEAPSGRPSLLTRDKNGFVRRQDWYDTLSNHYDSATSSAATLKTLASQSSSASAEDKAFQQQCQDALTDYSLGLGGIQAVLQQLGAGKGEEYEDRTNDLETLLKNTVNMNKDILNDTTKIVTNIPVLGPLLAPILFVIKCDLELLLDAVENLTDQIINALNPILRPLLPALVQPGCNGIALAGICL
ncbi:hypothetical protein FISHEDRAFT_69557 [Fistulina hepatica ATCC 64428]|uniref:Uncharacterized protein n=1 Tax=Fistulina hepatica ATCC 64428 TaxID=1128425 RepID=A0A0D7APN5_9AGAR|nr:hypothetical protein FISHEDRAFT_69557 [Fistulina hepatica ATCC 64428]